MGGGAELSIFPLRLCAFAPLFSHLLFPGPEAEAAQIYRDVAEQGVVLLDFTDHGPLVMGMGAAEDGDRAALASGAIELPARRAGSASWRHSGPLFSSSRMTLS